ncbi:MAG TPA: hypothetical protein VJ970_05215 [Flavobacteriaceae bacterium]|nr:hypothetical protein [Flavobacteriaceae bacterium]
MQKYWKIAEYVYLIIAIVCVVEIFLNWSVDRQRAYLYIVFGLVAVFMYFFRRRYRKRFEDRNK